MANLVIASSALDQAAQAVFNITSRVSLIPDQQSIKKILKDYTDAGIQKEINDWYYNLSSADKTGIINTLRNINSAYSPTSLETILNSLDYQAQSGWASELVARPRKAQEEYERKYQPQELNVFTHAVKNFFGNITKTISAALKGLGIDIPFPLLIILVVLLIIFIAAPKHA